MSIYRWQGIDPQGVDHCHRTSVLDVPLFVSSRFRQGWDHLTVDRDGVKVGQITTDGPFREWWAMRPSGAVVGEFRINLEGGVAAGE